MVKWHENSKPIQKKNTINIRDPNIFLIYFMRQTLRETIRTDRKAIGLKFKQTLPTPWALVNKIPNGTVPTYHTEGKKK